MAGLIAALFGGKNRPDPNPNPGLGGYDMPRGPVGEGGFPGSTAAAPPVHPQTVNGRRERQLTASQAQDAWTNDRFIRRNGTPRQPYARNPKQADDTYKPYTPVIGANAPGAQNVRNTVAEKYKADPSLTRSYLAAPNPGTNGGQTSGNTDNGAVLNGDPLPVMVQSRFVSLEGAQEGFAADRLIPYRIHARPEGYRGAPSNRGADLSGQRYTMAEEEETRYLPNGSYGIARKRGPNHRPVSFVRPGPWTANYYDEAPDEGSQAPNMVRQSGSNRKPAKKPAKSRPNEAEHRSLPSHRSVSNHPRRRRG